MCLAQGPQHSDAGEARTRSLSVSRSRVKHSTTEPLRSLFPVLKKVSYPKALSFDSAHCWLETNTCTWVPNTVDPDKMPQNVAFHLDLQFA